MSLWPFGKKKDKEKVKEQESPVVEENAAPALAVEPEVEAEQQPASQEVEAEVPVEEVVEDKPQAEESQKETEAPPEIKKPEKSKPKDSEGKKGWLSRLGKGLEKSSGRLGTGIKEIFTTRKLDDAMLEELEDLLISSDLGVKASVDVIAAIAKEKYDKQIAPEEVRQVLAKYIAKELEPHTQELTVDKANHPHVILFCGVNGSGKTTTMGKFANHFAGQGHKVMVAACDTYRAAAVEQLAVWAERSGCAFMKGKENADPASVAYTALEEAKSKNMDVLLIDTAGRLQNKKNLMEQLTKVVRVLKKLDESAPQNTVIVLDATTGQNAHSQVKLFGEAVDVNGMIITKLDGTAKGGVVVGLAAEHNLPIHAIGVGESIEDLRHFDAQDFAEKLVG